MTSETKLQMIAVKRHVPAWTPVQYMEIVDKIIKYCLTMTSYDLKIEKDYLVRKLHFGDTKIFGSITIEPHLLPMKKTMIWRIRLASYPDQGHFITPNNSSDGRIYDVADIVLKDFEETLSYKINHEFNLDSGDWSRKDKYRRSITYP